MARKKLHKRHKVKKAGSAPGTLIYTGQETNSASVVLRSVYDSEELEFYNTYVAGFKAIDTKTDWIDIRGLNDVELLSAVCNDYGIHALIQEDILNVYQRARIEELNPGYFLTFKALGQIQEGSDSQPPVQQVSLVFKNNTLITFQEFPDDLFVAIRERLEKKASKIRSGGPFYLMYALIDYVIDSYIHYYHHLDQAAERLEEQVETFANGDFKTHVHHLKLELMQFRRIAFPLREVLNRMIRMAYEEGFTDKLPYIKDLLDHQILLLEDIDECKDRLNALQELYNIHLQQKTNLVVQTLTIISTIFIPITFVAGVYGMNFTHMPELEWKYGYYMIIFLMILMSGGMLLYFRKKHWF